MFDFMPVPVFFRCGLFYGVFPDEDQFTFPSKTCCSLKEYHHSLSFLLEFFANPNISILPVSVVHLIIVCSIPQPYLSRTLAVICSGLVRVLPEDGTAKSRIKSEAGIYQARRKLL